MTLNSANDVINLILKMAPDLLKGCIRSVSAMLRSYLLLDQSSLNFIPKISIVSSTSEKRRNII